MKVDLPYTDLNRSFRKIRIKMIELWEVSSRRELPLPNETYRSISRIERRIGEMPMISDVLCECVSELDYYLNNQAFEETYQGEFRERIIRLRNEAEYLRGLLDVLPGVQLPPEVVLLWCIEAQRTRKVEDRCYVVESEAEALETTLPSTHQDS